MINGPICTACQAGNHGELAEVVHGVMKCACACNDFPIGMAVRVAADDDVGPELQGMVIGYTPLGNAFVLTADDEPLCSPCLLSPLEGVSLEDVDRED